MGEFETNNIFTASSTVEAEMILVVSKERSTERKVMPVMIKGRSAEAPGRREGAAPAKTLGAQAKTLETLF